MVQSLPIFAMSVFLIPLNIIMNKFWWQTKSAQKKGIHWLEWSRMTVHKSAGGLGFMDLRDFNISMLAKQGWRLLTNQQSLVRRLFKARYYPNNSFMEAKLGDNPSFIWRSILEAQPLLMQGVRWTVGSGKSIKILNQSWLNDRDHPYIMSNLIGLDDATVDSLMCLERKSWDKEVVEDLFNVRDQRCILNVQLDSNVEEDSLFWCKEVSGEYLVRSAYRMAQMHNGRWNTMDRGSIWQKMWKIRVPAKVLNLC